jgi:hypothetical protein
MLWGGDWGVLAYLCLLRGRQSIDTIHDTQGADRGVC